MNIAKALTAIILVVVSLIIAYVAVRILEPVLPIIAFIILLYFVIKGFIIFPIAGSPVVLIIIGIVSLIFIAVLIYTFMPLIKLIAFLLISWYSFKFLVRYYAEDIEADLKAVLED